MASRNLSPKEIARLTCGRHQIISAKPKIGPGGHSAHSYLYHALRDSKAEAWGVGRFSVIEDIFKAISDAGVTIGGINVWSAWDRDDNGNRSNTYFTINKLFDFIIIADFIDKADGSLYPSTNYKIMVTLTNGNGKAHYINR